VARTKHQSALLLSTLYFSVQVAYGQIELPGAWESELHSDHELVGTIWNSATGSFVSLSDISSAAASAKYLILGEKHDNPDHHTLQLNFVNYLISNARLGQLSFEMMDSGSQGLLDDIHNQELASLTSLKDYLEWDEEGWDWSFYGPLVQTAYQAEIPLAAGNISNAQMGEVYGLDALPQEYDVLNAETMDQLLVDIDESHCGLLPESQFPAMVRVQQARDYSLADSLLAPSEQKVNVLIAGNYHARQDLGVPNYLVSQYENLNMDEVVSIGFLEVSPGEIDPEAYLQRYGSQAAYDYILFTPVVSEEDYCASLRQ